MVGDVVSGGSSATGESETAIWAARNVEWPLPSSLSQAQFAKLLKASRQAAQQLGITAKAASVAAETAAASSRAQANLVPIEGGGDGGGGGAAAGTTGAAGVGDSSTYYGLSGFMSRVLNTSAASDKSDSPMSPMAGMGSGSGPGGARPLLPPRPGCVASANGWIVAVLECPVSVPTASAGPSSASPHASSAAAASTVILRLVSRWNVRRGGTAEPLALPPPLQGAGHLSHVFVDPTASHTIISASNGEAYYLHSSTTSATKLAGFGVGVDGNQSTAYSKDAAGKAVQTGISPGSYVTAVAWDKEQGTEGSTKKILLGTSAGEIYEYSLLSPQSSEKPASASGDAADDDASARPVLLHRLCPVSGSDDPSQVGAAVTGLYFERLRTGLLVLAASSGRHKRTRFYTFYSAHSSSFRMIFADSRHASLTELPGSVDFADLRLCNDSFGMRTATGIYYGKIDRAFLSQTISTTGHGNIIVESGILPYDDATSDSGGEITPAMLSPPISLAITPHHLITLSETNEVCFLNRVAQKVIQKERVDLGPTLSTTPIIDELLQQAPIHGELLMDIRRPDQVWLRKARSLVHISSSQEDRDVWKFTLMKCLTMPGPSSPSSESKRKAGKSSRWATDRQLLLLSGPPMSEEEKAQESLFEQAKSLCTNAAQKDVVTAIRAEYHLSQGRAELAAKYLAQCPPSLEPFPDTAIRLALPKLGIDNPQNVHSRKAQESLESSNLPLIAYLSDKMRAGTLNDDKMTSTMIGAWLTELYLHERGERLAAASLEDDATHASKEVEGSQRAMLARFLNTNVTNMEPKTIMKILTSHGVGAVECAVYAAQSGDIGTAVNAALENTVRCYYSLTACRRVPAP